MKPTLKHVADLVGVSLSTVSVVLNGAKSGTRVSLATRTAIQEAALKLNYQLEPLEKSGRKSRTGLIGLYADFQSLTSNHAFLASIIQGLQSACGAENLDLILHSIRGEGEAEQVHQIKQNRRVDGIVMFSSTGSDLAYRLTLAGIPTVAMVEAVSHTPSVVADDTRGMRLIATHLYKRGHRHVIYRDWHMPLISATHRRRAFELAAKELGLRVTMGRCLDTTRENALIEQEIDSLKRASTPATAFVCWEDTGAYGLCEELSGMGYKIPRDLAVVGFNGIPTVYPYRWNLTTIEAPWASVSQASVTLLLDLIAGKETPLLTVVPVKLYDGSTS